MYSESFLGTVARRINPIITAIKHRKKLIGNKSTPIKINKIPKHFLLSKRIANKKITMQTIINAILFLEHPFDFSNQSFSRIFHCKH